MRKYFVWKEHVEISVALRVRNRTCANARHHSSCWLLTHDKLEGVTSTRNRISDDVLMQ